MEPIQLDYVKLTTENISSFTDILTSTRDFDLEKQHLIGCLCNKKPCALVAFESEAHYSQLIWIEVIGGLRRRGIGSGLLSMVKSCLKSAKITQMTAVFTDTFLGIDECQAFLQKNGFSSPVTTQMMFLAHFDDILANITHEESLLPPQMQLGLVPLTSLSPQHEMALQLAVEEKHIPSFVLPGNAAGELLKDYSLGYFKDGNICATVQYSEFPNVLYLDSLYINKSYLKEGMHLLFYTLEKALTEYKKSDILALNAINTKSYALVEHFSNLMPHTFEIRQAMRINL